MAASDAIPSLLSFDRPDDRTGLTVVDHVERRHCLLHTADRVDPREVPTEEFYFPVDRGVGVTTDRLSLPHTVAVYVRNHAGFMIDELTEGDARELPEDLYSVELTAPIKLYLVFEAPFSVDVSTDEVVLEFEDAEEIYVGARSHHESPAATITTTDDPEDLMAAVSHFGSALKTTSVERSYPTLRGHPPTLELGDELYVPPVLDPPETGVRLVLPPDYRPVFVASSLAYYLGATVEPGTPPRIETDTGFEHRLDTERGFEAEAERVLKQVFFLDCVTRTEGYYPVDLHERNQIEGKVDLDFGRLYDASPADRLDRYLDVPYSTVEPHLPEWKLTAHTTLDPPQAEMLPFVVDDLAVIRSSESAPIDGTAAGAAVSRDAARGGFVRSTTRGTAESAATPPLIEVEDADSIEQAWLGEGAPVGASKAMIEAFHNRLDRTPTDGDIDITVVCNDGSMGEERDLVDGVYGSRDELPFDVRIHKGLTVEELRDVLRTDTDFFHYIGHIDADGFECTDGRFDAADLDRTGVDAFFLNACSSYQQGMRLIEAGGIAGVVTLQDVINSGAERIGKTLARLLNQGFPLQAALNIAKQESIMGGHYLVIGDGSLDITQTKTGIPALCDIQTLDNRYKLIYITFPTSKRGIGSITIPYISDNKEYFLTSGQTGLFKLEMKSLLEFLGTETMPVQWDHEFTWSDNITVPKP